MDIGDGWEFNLRRWRSKADTPKPWGADVAICLAL